MSSDIAIIGGGVAAGMAALILSKNNMVEVFKPHKNISSPIPELVPRARLFGSLRNYITDQSKFVQASKTNIENVVWNHHGVHKEASLVSGEDYFIYDKGNMAQSLFDEANCTVTNITAVHEVDSLLGYDYIVDCRGMAAVESDPTYEVIDTGICNTQCSYIIAERPEDMSDRTMQYWSGAVDGVTTGHDVFSVPVGEDNISIGVSVVGSDVPTHKDVLKAAKSIGIDIPEDKIHIAASASPILKNAKSSKKNVLPIGEAYQTSCPLTEYGTLKTLSQILKAFSDNTRNVVTSRRKYEDVNDPHIPTELFS